jgi:hypothetical protein
MAKTRLLTYLRQGLAGLLVTTAGAVTFADEAEGVVRISSRPAAQAETIIRGQSPDLADGVQPAQCQNDAGTVTNQSPADCPQYGECPDFYGHGCRRCVFGNNPCADRLRICSMNHRMRNRMTSDWLCAQFHQECHEKWNYLHCKFGYFCPSGACGKGAPPIGCYSMVYPLQPSYIDGRDTQVYAAPGYAGPVSVPLAPVVHHTYNYGWGLPSSRLTAVSNPTNGY